MKQHTKNNGNWMKFIRNFTLHLSKTCLYVPSGHAQCFYVIHNSTFFKFRFLFTFSSRPTATHSPQCVQFVYKKIFCLSINTMKIRCGREKSSYVRSALVSSFILILSFLSLFALWVLRKYKRFLLSLFLLNSRVQ